MHWFVLPWRAACCILCPRPLSAAVYPSLDIMKLFGDVETALDASGAGMLCAQVAANRARGDQCTMVWSQAWPGHGLERILPERSALGQMHAGGQSALATMAMHGWCMATPPISANFNCAGCPLW